MKNNYIAIIGVSCLISLFVGCSKMASSQNTEQAIADCSLILDNAHAEEIGLISELLRLNDSLIAEKSSTRTWPIFTRIFWMRVWDTVCSDVCAAWEEVSSDETYEQTINELFDLSWGSLGKRVVRTAVGASKKAYNDQCSIEMTAQEIYEETCIAFATLEEMQEGDDEEIGEELADLSGFFPGVIGINFPMDNGIEIDEGDEGDEVEAEIVLFLPEGYEEAETIAQGHNSVLAQIMSGLELEESYRDSLLAAYEHNEAITLQERTAIISRIDAAYYGMDVSNYVDMTDPAGQVLSLFGALYQSYVESLSDVNTIVNQYISTINASSELTSGQKGSLMAALSVAAYSSLYWMTVYGTEE